MHGRNARRRMINKIRTTIWRKQGKIATQRAEARVKYELCGLVASLNFYQRIIFILKGSFK